MSSASLTQAEAAALIQEYDRQALHRANMAGSERQQIQLARGTSTSLDGSSPPSAGAALDLSTSEVRV